jgi:large subunit ribosomal protein L28
MAFYGQTRPVEISGREKVMAAGRCDICERKPMYGNNVPFSQHRTRRRFVLNVHRRRLEINGVPKTVNICTRCLRTMSKVPKVRNQK